MSTGSDYSPDEHDGEEYIQSYLGTITDEDYATEEDGGTFFEDDADPLVLLNNMEQTDRQPFELLASRRRRSRRVATRRALEAEADEEDEEMEEEEEDQEEDEDEEMEGAIASGSRPLGAPTTTAGGLEDQIQDQWNDALAQRMGLQPVTNRKKQRNRERWRRRAAKKGAPRRKDYPEEAARKLGEANLLYASQRHYEAIALLMEVIRLAPNLPDPYHTLGLLHEAVGNSKKALDFFMIAAHLTPRDIGLWKRLAAMSSDHGLVRQAVYCYSQVLKRDREDVDARFDRALLYAELEDHKKAIEGFEQVQKARPEHPEAARALARVYYRTGQADKATEVLQAFIDQYPEQADLTHANILAELLAEGKNWPAVLALVGKASSQLIPHEEQLPIDLQVKAGIAHFSMGNTDAGLAELDPLLSQPVDTFADLYIEVTTAMEGLGRYDQVERFLRPVAESEMLGGPEIWSRLAECRRHLQGPGAVAEVWEEFTQDLSPEHPGYVDAMVCLAEAHREVGDDEAAAAALSRLEESLPSYEATGDGDPYAAEEHILRRSTVLLACGKRDMFLDVALPALGTTLRAFSREAEALGNMDAAARKRLRNVGRHKGGHGNRKGAVHGAPAEGGVFVGYVSDKRRRRQRAKQQQNEDASSMEGSMFPVHSTAISESEAEDDAAPEMPLLPGLLRDERPFTLLIDAIRALLDDNRPSEARELAQTVIDICGRRFSDRSKRDVLKLLLFEADLAERDFSAALSSLKSACARWPRSPTVWNALSRHLLAAGGTRQAAKFLTPLRNKHPDALPIALALGHCHLLNWQYAEALGEYFQAYRVNPDEPLVLLCIGAAMINRACTRKVNDRHTAILQAFSFLSDYRKKRCDDREAAYNIGRAAHQLGLLHLAEPMYKKVLEGDAATEEVAVAFDVQREAAYNLSLIYQSSGSMALAKKILREHMTI